MFIDDDDDRNLDVEWVKWVYYFRCHLDPNDGVWGEGMSMMRTNKIKWQSHRFHHKFKEFQNLKKNYKIYKEFLGNYNKTLQIDVWMIVE